MSRKQAQLLVASSATFYQEPLLARKDMIDQVFTLFIYT